jgi:hypothetical protein
MAAKSVLLFCYCAGHELTIDDPIPAAGHDSGVGGMTQYQAVVGKTSFATVADIAAVCSYSGLRKVWRLGHLSRLRPGGSGTVGSFTLQVFPPMMVMEFSGTPSLRQGRAESFTGLIISYHHLRTDVQQILSNASKNTA